MLRSEIAIFFASLFLVCQGHKKGKEVGSSCKGTGICIQKGCCPNDIIGKCRRGLDCCICQDIACGVNNQGRCVSDICPENTIPVEGPFDCCPGYTCCEKCTAADSACGANNQGQCVSGNICPGTTVPVIGQSDCCPGNTCCEDCRDVPNNCGIGDMGTCTEQDSCGIFGNKEKNCCSGYCCLGG